jgi:hypothetical protein
LATGGASGSRPVFGIWNIELADGDVYTHPCGTPKCCVLDVFVYENPTKTMLMTWCRCNLLCKWDLSVSPDIMEKVQFPSDLTFRMWTEKGNRILIGQGTDDLVFSLSDQPFPELTRISWEGRLMDIWKFSPGEGVKLAYYNYSTLAIWDCLGIKSLFEKDCKERIGSVQFSPDSETILVSTLSCSTTVECLSTTNGSSMWRMVQEARKEDIDFWGSSDFSADFEFFPDGKNAIIHGADPWGYVKILNMIDGSIVIDRPTLPCQEPFDIFIHPSGKWMILAPGYHADVIAWTVFPELEVQKCGASFSFQSSKRVSWKHSILIECSSNNITFSPIKPAPLVVVSPAYSFIHDIQFSPDGAYLVTVTNKGTTIWSSCSGESLISIDKPGQVEFTRDSSSLLRWRGGDEPLQLVRIQEKLIESLNVPLRAMAALIPSSNQILTVTYQGDIHLYFLDGSFNGTAGRLSFHPIPKVTKSLIISADGKHVAMIHDGLLVVKELVGSEESKAWPGAIRGISFGFDSSHILIVEDAPAPLMQQHTCIISYLRLSDMAITNRYMEETTWMGLFKARLNSSLEFIDLCDCGFESATLCSFDLHNGRRIIPSGIQYTKGGLIKYGKCPLLQIPRHYREHHSQHWWYSSGGHVVLFGENQRPAIVDVSSLIGHL